MLRGSNFSTGVTMKETTLAKSKYGRELKDVILLGAVPKRERGAELLYLVVKDNIKQRTSNCLSFAASLLGNSRILFLGKICTLLNMLDPKLAVPCYADTGTL